MKRGEIYSCNFGNGIGSEARGERPCIIVSNNRHNRFAPTVTVVPLTTGKYKANLPTHTEINCRGIMSTAMCEQIRTIDKKRLGGIIDKLKTAEIEELENALRVQLALNRREPK